MVWVETLFAGGGGASVCVLADFVSGGGGVGFRRPSSCSRIACACLLMNSAWSLYLLSAISPAAFLAATPPSSSFSSSLSSSMIRVISSFASVGLSNSS